MDSSGKTRPCWGFQRRSKVTAESYIFKEYGLIHWVRFCFVFCDLPCNQFSSLSLSRCLTLSAKKAEKSILQRFAEDGELAGETLAIHTKLPQAFCWERSGTHCFGYVCHRQETEIRELCRNSSLKKLKTKAYHPLNKRWPVVTFWWIIVYFTVLWQMNLEYSEKSERQTCRETQ